MPILFIAKDGAPFIAPGDHMMAASGSFDA
jgi:hypothetical protein